jgi:hypothetical protein
MNLRYPKRWPLKPVTSCGLITSTVQSVAGPVDTLRRHGGFVTADKKRRLSRSLVGVTASKVLLLGG